MSNATQDSPNSGNSRRRRSRGGQKRNNNQNRRDGDNRREGEHKGQGGRGGRGHQGGQARAEEFRPQGGASRPARKYSPPKLTFWQKILKAIGLYKEPVRLARPERQHDAEKPQQAEGRVKSNIRNARSGDAAIAGDAPQEKRREDRGERPERGERGERAPRNRDGNRSRGGDSSTVESARVYVGNLSYDVSESDLIDLFKGVGGVRNVEIVYNRTTHRSKGYGFVEMLHVDEAKRSVEVLHDQPFMGRKLIVSGAKSKGQDDREDRDEQPREERPRREAAAAAVAAPVVAASVEAPAAVEVAEAKIETIVEAEAAPEVVAAVHNVEAVGAPEVIVEAVEHQVTEAVEGEDERKDA